MGARVLCQLGRMLMEMLAEAIEEVKVKEKAIQNALLKLRAFLHKSSDPDDEGPFIDKHDIDSFA